MTAKDISDDGVVVFGDFGGPRKEAAVKGCLGLDLSLTSTGWAVVTLDGRRLIGWGTIKTKSTDVFAQRLIKIANTIKEVDEAYDIYDVAAERAFVGGFPGATSNLWSVYGAVVGFGVGRDVGLVAPTALKKWATGDGKAKKPDMIRAALVRFGVSLSDDEADAALVAAYCAEQLQREVD